ENLGVPAQKLALEYYQDVHVKLTAAIEGAKETLDYLKSLGLKMVVVTNNLKKYVEPQNEHLFKHEIGGIAIYDRARKPLRDVMQVALNDLNLRPNEVVK